VGELMAVANRLPSVTQIIGTLSKEGLPWAAARETALFAVNHRDQIEHLDPPEQVERLRRHHRGIWDHRAAMGTACHTVNETWARGETIDLLELVEKMKADTRVWADRPTEELAADLDVMVGGLEKAWHSLRPKTVSAEDVVRYLHPELGYIGQSDWRAVIDGKTWLIDLKTTAELDPTKAFYFTDWRLQLAAYRFCTERVHYNTERVHRPYAKGLVETATSELPPVDGCAVLQVRANEEWAFIPVEAGRAEHDLFLSLRRVYSWVNGSGKKAA
jgi:hypothetical protein